MKIHLVQVKINRPQEVVETSKTRVHLKLKIMYLNYSKICSEN
jgi:hypothetical protein